MTPPLPRTRLVQAPSLGARVYLKLESEMPTGSFKVRGALHALTVHLDRAATGSAALPGPRIAEDSAALLLGPRITEPTRRAALSGPPGITDVVASSTGNHGAAVGWAGPRRGVRATIFLPRHPNPVKKANIVRLGADVVEHGIDLAEAYEAATAHASRTGAFFLNDATDPDLPNGPAAIADEVIEDLPDVDVIYVPVGDTALVRGVAARAKQLKPSVRIVGVQAETAPSYFLSWRDGKTVTTPTANTIADGLATRTPVDENVRAIRTFVDDMRLVGEEAMIAAVGRLLLDEHVVAEPSAAATVAALMGESKDVRPRNVVLLITGCNVAPDILRRALCSTARPPRES